MSENLRTQDPPSQTEDGAPAVLLGLENNIGDRSLIDFGSLKKQEISRVAPVPSR